MMGDFNARVGNNHQIWGGILGKHGTGKIDSNCLRLLTLCREHNLLLTNTVFQLPKKHKNTWRHPRSGHWHMLDHIAIRKRDARECRLTRVMRGAECSTDHLMQRTLLSSKIRPPVRKKGMTSRKINVNQLKLNTVAQEFQARIATALEEPLRQDSANISNTWAGIAKKLYEDATESLGFKTKKHQDWFDENDDELTELVAEKNRAHNNYIALPSRTNRAR